jgi:hypothetical protein
MKFSPCLCVSVRAKSRARTSRCTRAGGSAGFQVEVKPARRVNLVVRSQGNDLTETQRHGEERNCQRDAGRLRSVRRGESPMEIFGPIRSSRASVSQCDLAVPIDEVLSVSPCLRESQEPSANKSLHASGRQRWFPSRSQTRPPRELGRSLSGK